MKRIDTIRQILQYPMGNHFYSRTVNLCRNKLTQAMVPAWKKFVLISVIVVFSQVNISLNSPVSKSIWLNSNSPVSKSIWLNSQYAIASTVAEEDSVYILSIEPKDELLHYLLSKQNLTYQAYSPCHAFADADIYRIVSLYDAKIRPGLLPQEDRVAPHIFLRAPPVMIHGPPYWCTDKGIDVIDLSRWPSCRSIKSSLAFLVNPVRNTPYAGKQSKISNGVNSWLAGHLRKKKNKDSANISSKKDDTHRLPMFQWKPRHLHISYFFEEDKPFFPKKAGK